MRQSGTALKTATLDVSNQLSVWHVNCVLKILLSLNTDNTGHAIIHSRVL